MKTLSALTFLSVASFATAFFVPSHAEHDGILRQTNSKGDGLAMKLCGRQERPLKQVIVRGGHQSSLQPQHQQSSSHLSSTPQAEPTPTSTSNLPSCSANSLSMTPQTTSGRSWMSYILERFIQLLFKGMTLPFPMLRELGGDNGSNTQTMLGFSVRECLGAIFSYLCLGTLSYSFVFEKWPLVDSLYFSVVTFTSVGYGDLTPTTNGGKWFTCFFGLSGLAFLGAAISTIGSSLLEKEKQLIQAAEEASRKRIKGIFEGMPHVIKSLQQGANVTKPQDENTLSVEQSPVGWKVTAQKALVKVIPSLSFLCFGGMVMARIEGWKWKDSIYYSIITGSTIGYGDFFPKTPLGRAWGILFIPLAVAAAGDVLGSIGSYLVERRQAKVFKTFVNRQITMDNLLTMDEDENGKVSREEYVRFMLTEMGLVEPEEYDELYEQFQRLDEDGSGYLDKKDLHLMARHRAGTISEKQAS